MLFGKPYGFLSHYTAAPDSMQIYFRHRTLDILRLLFNNGDIQNMEAEL